MLKAVEAVVMLIATYMGLFLAHLLLRYKIKVYTGVYTLFALKSTSDGSIAEGDPRPVTYSPIGLVAEGVKAAAWLGLAVWMGFRILS